MIIGAIGNDGMNGFDNSITATAHDEYTSGRGPASAINGAGIQISSGEDGDQVSEWEHDSGSTGTGNNWNWLGDRITGGSSIGWYKVDLGSSYQLDEALLFNFNPDDSARSSRGVNSVNIYTALSDPGNNSNGNNTEFNNTGWSLLRNQSMTRVSGNTFPQSAGQADVIDFGGQSARYVALEIVSNHGDSSFVGLGEVQFFATTIPEPSSLMLIGMALGAALFLRRRA